MIYGYCDLGEGRDWKAMADSQREKAVDDVRGFFILERIVEAEKIEVSGNALTETIGRIRRRKQGGAKS